MSQQGKQQQLQAFVTIYGYKHSPSGNIYVGSANKWERRKKTHLASLAAEDHHCESLQDLWLDASGENFIWLILEELVNTTKEERDTCEARWIASFGELALNTNKRAVGWSFHGHTEASKAKIGRASAQRYVDNPELRAALSERLKTHNPGDAGRRNRWERPGSREEYAEKMRAYWSNPENREAHAERGRQKNAMHDPVVRQKHHDIIHSKEYGENQSKNLREKRWSKPENRVKYGKAMRAHWADPAKKAETLEKRRLTRLRNKNLKALAKAKATVEACIKSIETQATL